jgi:hypothetical protein
MQRENAGAIPVHPRPARRFLRGPSPFSAFLRVETLRPTTPHRLIPESRGGKPLSPPPGQAWQNPMQRELAPSPTAERLPARRDKHPRPCRRTPCNVKATTDGGVRAPVHGRCQAPRRPSLSLDAPQPCPGPLSPANPAGAANTPCNVKTMRATPFKPALPGPQRPLAKGGIWAYLSVMMRCSAQGFPQGVPSCWQLSRAPIER